MTTTKIEWDEATTNKVIDEVAQYSVSLVEDPTLPEHGAAYLNKATATCRNYSNRVLYYIQSISSTLRHLRMELKQAEMDLEFKIQGLLADDAIVRQQSSIEDRKALAYSKHKEEYETISSLKIQMLDIEETGKILRMRYTDLQRTMTDIKLQRQIVKDDHDGWMGGGGYTTPQTNRDRTVPDGMKAPIKPKLDPKDLLDSTKRPADLPEPVDMVHASQIAAFFNTESEPVVKQEPEQKDATPPEPEVPATPAKVVSYADLLADD
jgi:hypothetical protein